MVHTAFSHRTTALIPGRLLSLLAAVGLATLALSSQAQTTYPTKAITLVVPYQAGGGADAVARLVAEAAAKELGQNIVIENKAGAEGQLGTKDVAQATPDGYRLLLGGAGSLVLVPALRKVPPYDPVKDFTAVAGVCEFSFFMYVNANLPAKSMNEYVAYAKANPGKINYATGNNQGLMSMAYFNREAGLTATHITYKGEPAAIADLVTNRVQAMFATTAPAPYVKTGQLRVLATTLTKRSPVYPDVPTMTEAGQKEVPFGGGWVAIFGPAGMPKDIVEKLSRAFKTVANKPEVQARMVQLGLAPMPYGSDEMAAHVKAQVIVYRDAVRDLKMNQE